MLIEAYATSRGRKQLKGIEDVSKKYGFKYGVQTLLSFGGLTSINHPRLHETMISGPIGGILGAAYVGKLIGNDSLICSDMGGTSFDMGVITRGQTRIENEPLMDRFKLNVPTLHLDTIGAGAGMILKVDPLTKKVSLGPESAGSDPGPICFDRGGTEPTIADCDAILGRLNPDYFLGGKVKLQVEKARRAFQEKCSDILGVGLEEAAEGMIDMLEADANNALRRVISGQGIHPRNSRCSPMAARVRCILPAAPEASASRTSSPSSSPPPFRPSAAPRPISCAGIRCRRSTTFRRAPTRRRSPASAPRSPRSGTI